MDFEEIARAAYQGARLPKYTAQEEQWAYLSMRSLYREYLGKAVGKEQAAAEKKQIKDIFEAAKTKREQDFSYQKELNALRVRIGAIAKEMTKSACPLCQKAIAMIDGRIKDDPWDL